MSSNDAVGSLEWLVSWEGLQHAALVQTLRSVEAGTVRFIGQFGPNEVADAVEKLSDKWRHEQATQWFARECDVNLNYAPPDPMEEAFRKIDDTFNPT